MSYDYDFSSELAPVGSEDNYWLDDERLSCAFHQQVPQRMADLLEVAMSVYAADRLSHRSYEGMNTGHRQINMRVGVHDPDFWARPEMSECLGEFLYWMSEDEWSFHFTSRQGPLTTAGRQGFLFSTPPEAPATVSLFSGGLDSLAGLAKHSGERSAASHVLVSGYTHNRLAGQQRRQVDMIRSVWERRRALGHGPELYHVAVPFGIDKSRRSGEEKSQRTRALVFLSLGVATAVQARSDTLWVYENGTGALNLPLNASQLGVDNYRGIHPRSLIMAERLFELALETKVNIRNPFLYDMKAGMCRSLAVSGLAEVVGETVSCDNYPVRVQGKTQCGHCTSCVLRRQAIRCGELTNYDPPEAYNYDVLDNVQEIDRGKLHGFEVMRGQAHDLEQCLTSDNPWLALASSFPELERTCLELSNHHNEDPGQIRDKIVRLYRTYAQEWRSFPNILRRVA